MTRRLLCALLAAVLCAAAYSQTPESAHAAKLDAKRASLLRYLKSVADSDRYLSGQRWSKSDWDEIKAQTGKLPAIMCVEYCAYEGNRKLNGGKAIQWREINPVAIKHWNAGGLVRITCHFPNPYMEDGGGLRTRLGDGGEKLFSAESSPEKTRWLGMLAEVANGVKDLNKRGVMPIFGPMHEMNGGWFWWGSTLSPSAQKKLWGQICSTLGKNGCRAVWLNALSPQIPIDEENGPDFGKMDIIGCDVYGFKSANNLGAVKDKAEIAGRRGKIFTLSEFGAYSAHNPQNDREFGTYDLTELTRQMDAHCPRAYGAVFWSGPWGIHRSKNAKEFMNDKKIITLPDATYEGK